MMIRDISIDDDYTIVLQKDSYYLAITMLLPCNNYAFTLQYLCFYLAITMLLQSLEHQIVTRGTFLPTETPRKNEAWDCLHP